jgi:hypothetical protein
MCQGVDPIRNALYINKMVPFKTRDPSLNADRFNCSGIALAVTHPNQWGIILILACAQSIHQLTERPEGTTAIVTAARRSLAPSPLSLN